MSSYLPADHPHPDHSDHPGQELATNPPEKRPKMNGAMRKRYHHWLKQGLSREEAFEKSKLIFKLSKNSSKSVASQSTETHQERANKLHASKRKDIDRTVGGHQEHQELPNKRGRQNTETFSAKPNERCSPRNLLRLPESNQHHSATGFYSPQADGRPPQESSTWRDWLNDEISHLVSVHQQISEMWNPDTSIHVQDRHQQASSPVTVGVVAKSYPARRLTEEDFTHIKQVVEQQIAKNRKASIKPRFTKLPCLKITGWIQFSCSNSDTADWLKSLVIWTELDCKCLAPGELPQEFIFTGYFLGSADKENDQVLGMIEAQNEGLDTDNWYVRNRTEEKTCLGLTVIVDQASYEALCRKIFWLDFGFGQKVKLYRKDDKNRATSGRQDHRNLPRPETRAKH
jgi:Domain of unknown function (DUF4780)